MRGRNRSRPIKIFRDFDTRSNIIKSNIIKSNTITSKIKPIKISRKKHNTAKCIRNWYHIKEKERNVIKQYNIIIT